MIYIRHIDCLCRIGTGFRVSGRPMALAHFNNRFLRLDICHLVILQICIRRTRKGENTNQQLLSFYINVYNDMTSQK